MEELLSFQPLLNHILRPPFRLIVILIIIMLKKDQLETKDLINKSLLSSKTTIGLVMNKSGSYRDTRLNLSPSGNLLTPLVIA